MKRDTNILQQQVILLQLILHVDITAIIGLRCPAVDWTKQQVITGHSTLLTYNTNWRKTPKHADGKCCVSIHQVLHPYSPSAASVFTKCCINNELCLYSQCTVSVFTIRGRQIPVTLIYGGITGFRTFILLSVRFQ